ncbi:MAG: pyridoxal phosphate-dependent aminotransferase [Caldiserica bacterium]|jgi:aspartate aminotransferase/aminotransferase|nr:pyridoxal phosphate-dependent aminotransferase [Caldisericota bacterium]MDH7562351.1 pyridoxal phosphate-dependent aminotransferase [Caldisericota bacterium]
MKKVSQKALEMPGSGIREIMDLAWREPDCIHLEVGQPDFPTPSHIKEAGIKAIEQDFTGYTPSRGIPELREAICKKLWEKNGIKATGDNITVCPGAVTALDSAIMTLVEDGDEVLLPDPGWPNPEMMVKFLGGIPVHYHLLPQKSFLPDLQEMEEKITPKTKAIVLNTPSNPTGAVFSEELLKGIYRLVQKYDLYLITDEIYEDLVFEGRHFSVAGIDQEERVLSVFGFSKSYAMTGWRLGYIFSPVKISAIITKLQEPLVSCPSSISQKAGFAAISGPKEKVEEMRETYRRRRDLAVSILKAYDLYEYTPGGAFYIMVNVSALGEDSREVAKKILREHKVAVAPGTAFGESMRKYVRVSLAASDDQIKTGLERICGAIKEARSSLKSNS